MSYKLKTSLLVSCFLFLLSFQSISARFFSFDLNPPQPLHKGYFADPFNTDFSLSYIWLGSGESRPAYVYKVGKSSDGNTTYEGLNINQYYEAGKTMIQMRAGTSVPAARISFSFGESLPALSFEANIRGGFRSLFFAYSGTDMLGVDGTYFIGLNAALGNFLTFSFGRKHYSGHYGDEILLKLDNKQPANGSLFKDSIIDYVRQDPLCFALSLNPIKNWRFYGELRLGDTGRILKPDFTGTASTQDNYRAREIQVGTEIRHPIPYLGDFILALDITFHEFGKFVGKGSGTVVNGEYQKYEFVYDENALWETEFQIVVAQAITNKNQPLKAHLVATYHWGRFPLFAFHMSKSSYISLGATVTF